MDGNEIKLHRIRNTGIVFLALIGLQFWLGMSINLEVDLPVKHLSAFSSLFYYASHFGFVLAHVINGFLLLVFSLLYLVLAFKSNIETLKIISILGTASVIGAITLGILFHMSGQFFGWSIGMAMSAVSALIVYSLGFYFIGVEYDRRMDSDVSVVRN
jgi:peptidoglycan biosynthesis protein MviN/MurJ (putative lipid II flippase)